MSGIAGLYRTDGAAVNPASVARMTETIAHRGPDEERTWSDGQVGFGHRLLYTTPESVHETLPHVSEAAALAITADARIDNRASLINALGLADRPGVITDTDLIVAAYQQWGDRCAERLVGAFAFVIWDGNDDRVFCARDHIGIKPFYYHYRDDQFVFGSELKALLCLESVPTELNEMRCGEYLISLLDDKTGTFYEDLYRLPPAHSMVVDADGTMQREYWALDPTNSLELHSESAYATRFRELFTEAVRCRMRSNGPIGTLLSGGLDSSSITCTAESLLADSQPLHTFSAVFDEVPESDERSYIDAVLEHGNGRYEPHFVRADQLSPLTDNERVFWHQDEPFHAPNHFINWSLYRAADHAGVRVVLDGYDGDTTLSHGEGRMAELARHGRWLSVWRELSGFAANFAIPRRDVFWHRVVLPLAPDPLRPIWRRFRWRNGYAQHENPAIDPDFTDRIGLEQRVREVTAEFRSVPQKTRTAHYRKLTRGVIPFTLEVADRAAAAFGIEPRYPFFDRRLMEFCLALPPEQKLRDGWTRVVLRDALEGVLPPMIRWRPDKSDLGPNFTRALMHYEGDRVAGAIANGMPSIDRFVDMDALREIHDRLENDPSERDVMTLWRALTLALWLRDGPPKDIRQNLTSHEV